MGKRGNKDIATIGEKYRFNSENAVERGKKGIEAKRRKKHEKEVAELFAFAVPPLAEAGKYCAQFGLDPNDERTAFEIAFARSIVQPAMNGDRDAFMRWAEMRGKDGTAVRDKLRFDYEIQKLEMQYALAGKRTSELQQQEQPTGNGFIDALDAARPDVWDVSDDPSNAADSDDDGGDVE